MTTTPRVPDSSLIGLRRAQPADLAAVEALLRENRLPIVGVREAFDTFRVADADGRIVGAVGVEPCGAFGLLRSAVVAADWRGRRIARRLVDQIIGDAEADGRSALYLLTTTAETYFPSFGFEIVPRDEVPDEIRATEEFRGACPASATAMRLALPR